MVKKILIIVVLSLACIGLVACGNEGVKDSSSLDSLSQGEVLFKESNDNFEFTVISINKVNDEGYSINCSIDNKVKKSITYVVEQPFIHGVMLDTSWEYEVPKGKEINVNIDLSDDNAKEKISSFEEDVDVEFKLSAYYSDDKDKEYIYNDVILILP